MKTIPKKYEGSVTKIAAIVLGTSAAIVTFLMSTLIGSFWAGILSGSMVGAIFYRMEKNVQKARDKGKTSEYDENEN